jgi:uncharacterized membrane protein
MDSSVREWLDLVFRWLHLIAGIMWVGNSMLFNWLDRNLEKVAGKPKEHMGQIWLLHSGAFYEVEKKMLAPGQMPATLHWFKWQSYTTWISGFCLLLIVYYWGGSGLVDAGSKVTHEQAKDLGLAMIGLGFLCYDGTMRLFGKRAPALAQALVVSLLIALIYAATHVFSGRAAFVHVGALLGTCMAGNVFFHIIPSQRELVKATEQGREQEMALSLRAKERSIHNNYLTFPLLLLMLSNHFPSAFSHQRAWLVLLFIVAVGAGIRHILNIRFTFSGWIPALGSVIVVGLVGFAWIFGVKRAGAGSSAGVEKVSFTRVHLVVRDRCMPCHSEHPTDSVYTQAPKGVILDTPLQIQAYADQIKTQAVVTRAMPQGNKTGITEAERNLLGQWVLGGASIEETH